MAILTAADLARLRQQAQRDYNAAQLAVGYTRGNMDAAFQAVEDLYETDTGRTGSLTDQVKTAINDSMPRAVADREITILESSYLELKSTLQRAKV